MKRPGNPEPDPAGDHAAERLREFLEKRKPQETGKPDDDVPVDKPPVSAPRAPRKPSAK